jgi:hypothetical protein
MAGSTGALKFCRRNYTSVELKQSCQHQQPDSLTSGLLVAGLLLTTAELSLLSTTKCGLSKSFASSCQALRRIWINCGIEH